MEDVPADAAELFSKNETFRKFRANLDLNVAWYNKVRQTVLEVEFPLIEQQLATIDSQLEKAEKSLNWTNDSKYNEINQSLLMFITSIKTELFIFQHHTFVHVYMYQFDNILPTISPTNLITIY